MRTWGYHRRYWCASSQYWIQELPPISYGSTRFPGWESLVIVGEIPTIADANGRPLRTSRQIPLVVRLGDHTMRCSFVVCERLAAPVILGCKFSD